MQKSVHFDEFMACIADLIAEPEVRRMRAFSHHAHVTCLHHSVAVAYGSFLFCKRFGGDARAAARGGLLHDFFLYDWRVKGSHTGWHGVTHPAAALRKAEQYFALTDREREVILCHMFPLGLDVPLHIESLAVCLMDKICAINEFVGAVFLPRMRRRVAEVIWCH